MAKKPNDPEISQQRAAGEAKAGSKRNKQMVRAGVAFGIGSAAIVAALLYANRSRKND